MYERIGINKILAIILALLMSFSATACMKTDSLGVSAGESTQTEAADNSGDDANDGSSDSAGIKPTDGIAADNKGFDNNSPDNKGPDNPKTESYNSNDPNSSEASIETFEQVTEKPKPEQESSYDKIAYAGDNLPVSRAQAAKMLSYIGSDTLAIKSMNRVINFKDTPPDSWYDKYINAVVTLGYMSGTGDSFMPEDPLTINQAQLLLDKIDTNNRIKIKITDENKDKAISYALWIDLYYELVSNLNNGSNSAKTEIERTEIVVLATPGNNKKLTSYKMVTNIGPLSFEGLLMDDYIDKKIGILKKGSEILAFLGVSDDTPTIECAYLISYGENSVRIFSGGAERTYLCDESIISDIPSGTVCDITITGNKAEEITAINEKSAGEVKNLTDFIELEDSNLNMAVAQGVTVYSIADGTPKRKTIEDVLSGSVVDIYSKNNEVKSIVIRQLGEYTADTTAVRVAINTSGFKSLIHSSVSLTSDSSYTVRWGDRPGEQVTYTPGEVFTVDQAGEAFNHIFRDGVSKIYIEPLAEAEKPAGKIQLMSIKRSWPGGESPKYRGKIEIVWDGEGFTVINELSMNEYLYAVVPSEIPDSYGLEAAKVQAVTARSFAYVQYYSDKFNAYGANIDDSVNSQVYNNVPESDISIEAVDATDGECLVYDGRVISANYFSTSCGMTSNIGEVWANGDEFPEDSAEYLQSGKQYSGEDYGDLTVEENAYKFLKDNEVQSYDSWSPWFRWSVEMTAEEIADSINSSLKRRYESNHKLILTLKDGEYKSSPVETIGNLLDINVTRRGEGGNIIFMEIIGSEASVLAATEYNVRALLAPGEITRKDGSKVTSNSLMPSASFVMDKSFDDDGNLVKILFSGGGHGHGVGMSQAGVNGMIKEGHTFDDILKHYYQGAEVRKMI